MKNKFVIAGAVIIVLLLVGGGVYLGLSKSKPASPKTTVTATPKATQSTALGTLKSLLASGKSQSCNFSYPDNSATGTYYFDGNKFAGNFSLKEQDGKTLTGNTVSDGTYVYVWTSNSPSGIKMKLDTAINETPLPSAQNQNQGVDLNQKVNYKCSPWTADNSKFQPPSNIQFTDMSNFLNKTEASPAGPQTASPCEQITNPQAKAACENALKNQ